MILSIALALCSLPASPGPMAAQAVQDCFWSPAAPAPLARVEAQSVVIDGKLYLFGGFFNLAGKATPRTDVYDPATDSWTRLADMTTTVTHHTAAVDGQTVWVAGGFFGDHGGFTVNTVQRYDVQTDTWSTAPRLPGRRAGGALVRLGRELHFFGGFSTRIESAGEHWVLDLDNVGGGWDTMSFAPLPVPRGQLGAAVVNGVIYAAGGQDGHDITPLDLDLVDAYDPLTNSWIPVASLPTPRSHIEASTFASGGRLVVAGGRNNQLGGANALVDVSAYDPLSDSWSSWPDLPGPFIGPSLKPLGNQLLLSTGGTLSGAPTLGSYSSDASGGVGPETRINVGGPAALLSEDWCEDSFFAGGMPLSSASLPAIAGTTDDTLYHTERTGTQLDPLEFEYHIPVALGDYRIQLHFADLLFTAVGERVFDVRLEGRAVLTDYDLVAGIGPLTAAVHTFDVHVTDGFIDLEFLASVYRPTLSGIEVLRLPDGTINPYCSGAPNSVGPGATLDLVGSVSVAVDNFSLVAAELPANQLAVFLISAGQAMTPFGSGMLCLANTAVQSPLLSTGPGGTVTLGTSTAIIPTGVGWNIQLCYLDNAPFRFNCSAALELTFTP